MRRSFRIGLAISLTGFLIVGLARTWGDEAEQDKAEVAALIDKMQTVCIGRFIIEMPTEAQVDIGRAHIDGFDVVAFNETIEEFQKRLADREEQIKTQPDRLGGNKNLESAKPVKNDNGLVGKVFLHSRTVTEGTRANGLELERYRNEGMTVEALMHGNGVSIDLASQGRNPVWTDDVHALIAKLVANPDNRIPAESGFCIDRAFIRDPLTVDHGEKITMFAGIPSYPDVKFKLLLSAGLKPDEQGLLERADASGSWLSPGERLRISKLRAAPREIAGLPGEELVKSFVEKNDVRVYSFWWEVNGRQNDVFIPHLVFKMDTGYKNGEAVQSSLSERTAIRLWDKILSSIRVRPSNQRKNVLLAPAPTPPATQAPS